MRAPGRYLAQTHIGQRLKLLRPFSVQHLGHSVGLAEVRGAQGAPYSPVASEVVRQFVRRFQAELIGPKTPSDQESQKNKGLRPFGAAL